MLSPDCIPKSRTRHLTRLGFFFAIAVLLVSVFLAITSGFWHYEFRRWSGDGFSCRYLEIACGRAEMGRTSITRVMDTGASERFQYQPGLSWRSRWPRSAARPVVSTEPYGDVPDQHWEWIVSIPFWIPACVGMMVVAPPLVARAFKRCRSAIGRCEACGYSLAGLTSDLCPECGGTIPASRSFQVTR